LVVVLSKYRFGPYELSTRTRELHKHGRKVKLRPQPYQVLVLLVEHAGDVVTREQVRERIWASDTFVDFEHGLNTAIKELRGALSDSPKEPRYIETLPKLGYRLIVPVEPVEPFERDAGPAATDAATPESVVPEGAGLVFNRLPTPSAGQSAALFGDPPHTLAGEPPTSRALNAWALAAVALLCIAGLFFSVRWIRARTASRDESAARAAGSRIMLAVLPFENLTGDAGEEYFSDGLTEEMIAQLGRLDPAQMGVIARTSVMRYKHTADALDQVQRQLGVQYVLEGSVRRDAGRVRITTQLIQTKDQTRVWGKEYDRELSNLLELQGEIAAEIASEVDIRLAPAGRAAGEKLTGARLEAYDLYLRGRYFWNKRTPAGLQRAVEFFQQAVDKDPTYARAHAGLADSYALMSSYSFAPPNEAMPKARIAALKAVQLDPYLAEAHASLAVIAQNYGWDWATAEREYRRAIELDDNYATAHHWYAEELALVGRFPEALAEIDRARKLDPISLIIGADTGAIFYFSRQYDQAITQFRAVLDMEPYFPRATMVIFSYVQERKYADALASLKRWEATAGNPGPRPLALLAYVYGMEGQKEKAKRTLDALHLSTEPPYSTAIAEIGIGDKQKALDYLERAYADRTISTGVKVDPTFDPLRQEPRFQKILLDMHLQ
jgi:TolB-like protein/DNA-binding winged helix-turn-helix (wHTH) protein/Tfp pilus assembly protein PilF